MCHAWYSSGTASGKAQGSAATYQSTLLERHVALTTISDEKLSEGWPKGTMERADELGGRREAGGGPLLKSAGLTHLAYPHLGGCECGAMRTPDILRASGRPAMMVMLMLMKELRLQDGT